jgi:hypothetical protein
MVVEYVSPVLKFGMAIAKFIPHLIQVLWNYRRRPNLELSARHISINFTDNKEKNHSFCFPAIKVHNGELSEITIDLNNVFINGESLSYIMQQNISFLKTSKLSKPEVQLNTTNKLINIYRENWNAEKFIKIPAHEDLSIPLYPRGMSDSMYFMVFPEAKVFFPKGKIIIEMIVNSRKSHFAVNRTDFLKVIINWLVHEK